MPCKAGESLSRWRVAGFRVQDGRVSDVGFKVEGCIPAVACASCLTEMMRGKPLQELSAVTAEQIEASLDGLPSASRHASALAIAGLQRLLEALRN